MVGGCSIFHGVGVGFLLACLGIVELLWDLGCWKGRRKRKSILYPVWNRPRELRERIHCGRYDITPPPALIPPCHAQLFLASSFTPPCLGEGLFIPQLLATQAPFSPPLLDQTC